MTENSIRKTILLFLKGLFMGIADTIPGVSGGTIAFITGIYSELVHSLSELFSFIVSLIKWKPSGFKKINFQFFIPLGLGIIIAIFSFSKIIKFLLEEYTAFTFAFFFGLIAASALFLYKQSSKFRFENFILLVMGFLFAYLIAGASILHVSHSLPIIFLAGMVAICAMILPGISGAFILLLLNQYEFLITALHDFKISVIASFALGAGVGLLSFSRLLDYILKRFKSLTISFLIGVMLGSLRVPIQRISFQTANASFIFLWCIIGFLLVLALESWFKKR